MSGEEIARELINVLTAQYGVSTSKLVAAMHDHAACNGVALRTIKVVYSSIVEVGCFFNTLDLVCSKFVTPCPSSFMVWWISLFSHRRWWSKYEVIDGSIWGCSAIP